MTLNCSQELVQMIIEFMYMSIKEDSSNDFNNINNFYVNHMDSLDGTALKAWDTFQEYYGGVQIGRI